MHPTPLIGREAEMTYIINTLDNPSCQLLTLIGMGGVGKTRVAGEIFHHMKNFADGVVWVSLDNVQTHYDIAPTIARHSHFDGIIHSHRELLPYLADKSMLIILDQYEHLSAYTEWLLPFLDECKGIKWLVTSQVALNLSLEWQVALQPLDHIGEDNPAFQLFAYHATRVSRADVIQADKPTIMHICDHLAGHPLAIQLVCRWLKTLSPQDILARLGTFDLLQTTYADIPPRQRNLWGVLRQQWNFLSADEQVLLSQLAFFEGDFSLEAILTCCHSDVMMVDNLVSRSLLIADEGRYRLHSLIRQFIHQHAPADADFIHRYSDYYLDMMNTHASNIKNEGYLVTQRLFDTHYANLRKAWQQAVLDGRDETLIAITPDFFLYTHTRGRNSDFRTWLDFANSHIPIHSALWVIITYLRLYIDIIRGDIEQPDIENQLRMCLKMARSHQMKRIIAHIIRLEGDLLLAHQRYHQALSHYEQAENGFTDQDDTFELARTWNRIGIAYLYIGDFQSAGRYLHQSIRAKRQHHIYIEWIASLNNLAYVHLYTGNITEAQRLVDEMQVISQTIHFNLGKVQAYQLEALMGWLLGDTSAIATYQHHIQTGGIVIFPALQDVHTVLNGLSHLIQHHPQSALTCLDTLHSTDPLDRFWHGWAYGWAYIQHPQPDSLYQHICQLIPIAHHFEADLITYMVLWLCAMWFIQTDKPDQANPILSALASHPISRWGIFQAQLVNYPLQPSANTPDLQALFGRIAPQFGAINPPSSASVPSLSTREIEILTLVAQDYSNQAIADTYHLTVGTVKVHLHRIYQKLDVTNRIQAVRVAQAHRLLPLS
ncbi:MAG: hypothetical protein KJ043_03420 [Anaerolineae bacterium]|nr:hypothetical protein [Anaerolineae bacterium]